MTITYVKAPPGFTLRRSSPKRELLRVALSSIFLTLGVMATTSVVYPMITYQTTFAPKFVRGPQVLGQTSVASLNLSSEVAEGEPTVVPEMVNTSLDYTNSNNWFGGKNKNSSFDSVVYQLSIPHLGIIDATARNDHTDLKESLIHYPGTALPGDLGNAVIFGHSVLPQFFNPKNYLTIFSKLHTLELEDQIIIKSGPATYTYQVKEMYSTSPSDLAPLAQRYDNRYLTLITCTPPGTYLKRLIVKAVLI